MTGVRFADVQARPAEFLNLTSLTLEEFEALVAPFEAAFQDHMAAWRLDGKPRTARRFTVYRTCPLATPEDRLFFLLTYLKTYAVQVVQGRLFGMSQSKANQWIHVLLPALLAALRGLGDAPARSLTALAHKLAVSEGPLVVAPLEEPASSPASASRVGQGSPPFAHDGTERRIVRPQDPAEQTDCYSGKKKDHTVKNILLVNALLIILFLSDTVGSMTSGLPNRTPYQPEAGCCRISASWPSRFPRWRSSCRPGNHRARTCHWRSKEPTRRSTPAGCGSSMSTAVSSAVASSRTGSACGSRASGMS